MSNCFPHLRFYFWFENRWILALSSIRKAPPCIFVIVYHLYSDSQPHKHGVNDLVASTWWIYYHQPKQHESHLPLLSWEVTCWSAPSQRKANTFVSLWRHERTLKKVDPYLIIILHSQAISCNISRRHLTIILINCWRKIFSLTVLWWVNRRDSQSVMQAWIFGCV